MMAFRQVKAVIKISRWQNLLAFVLCVGGAVTSADYSPKVGEPHVDFVLPNIETREPVSLAQYRGKKVLLVHFASW